MIALSFLWLGLGLCNALLIWIARPAHNGIASRHYFILFLLLIGMLVALVTGWLGTWLYGRIAATACVLWITPTCLWLLFRFLKPLQA